jgi:NCS1 family nucleobase:cation symporter-1
MSAATTTGRVVEAHSIEPIPDAERHGRPWNLFTLWFASNITVVAVITGAVAVSLGLSLTWSIIAMVAGNLIGGVFMAYHSVQGPRMGLPQMIQSRAQFGSAGAVLPMIVTVLMYLGFQIEGNISFGAAMAAQTGLSVNGALVLFGFIGIMTALFGYRVIHGLSKIMTVVTGLIFAAFLVKLISAAGSAHIPATHSTFANILLAVSISVSWQITWAPYVSDYSRYLPSSTSASRTFWYTYAGSVLTAVFAMLIGVLAAFVGGNGFSNDPLEYLTNLFPALNGVIFWLLMIFGFGGASGAYGSFLTAHAAVSGRGAAAERRIPLYRALFVVAFGVVSTVLSIVSSANLISTFTNITTFLLYLLVPWTAINLMDYFVIRRGSYDIPQLLLWNGRYGTFNARAVVIYLAAIGIQIPFVNSSLYEGPIARSMGGADIAWIVGLAFSAVAYWLAARGDAARDRAAARQVLLQAG